LLSGISCQFTTFIYALKLEMKNGRSLGLIGETHLVMKRGSPEEEGAAKAPAPHNLTS